MWSNILNQEKVIKKLTGIYESGKISHAYLFYGPEGTGKDAAAIEFAKLINCKHVTKDGACDKCSTCKSINSIRSEFFNFICALPSGKSGDTDNDPLENLSQSDYDEYLEQISIKSANPYYKIKLDGANNIKISSIRQLVTKIYVSKNQENKKVFLISGADKMKQEAANSLLKILEEPPENSMIILTTSRLNSLPQTITGRCHKIFFEPLNHELISERLKTDLKDKGYDDKTISLAARASQGSYSWAMDLLEYGIDELRDKALDFMIAILRNDYLNQSLLIKELGSTKDKTKLKYLFFFLNIWFRDLMIVKSSGIEDVNNICNIDKSERLQKFVKNYPNIDFYNVIMELEEADRSIEQNINSQIILANLSFRLKELILI